MSSLSIRSFTLFREEQPVRDALVLFTLTLLLHFLGAMLRLVQELSFFWPLNAVMAGIFARYVWLNRSYFYAVCFAAMLVYDGLTSRWGMGFASLLINFSNIVFIVTLAQLVLWDKRRADSMLISPVIVASSVEAINTLVKQLALRADFDFQTRVYSRSGLSEALKRQTLPADKLLTVMVLDIDGFKRVNDALGHEGGDCVLTQFAQQVRQLVGEQGMVARIGGEEFAVAAVVDSAQQGYLLAEKIRHGVESQPFGLGQNPIHLTISLGLETREVGHARITELFNQLLLAADDEMVKAKQSGRNQICMPTLTESAP